MISFYWRKLISSISILSGVFLILEHLWHWNGFDLTQFPLGHEWYGFYLILFGLILSGKELKTYIKNN